MAELKVAEDWPVRDASPCPRCCPWCRHAQTRPTAAIDLPDQPTRGHLFTGVVADVGRRGGRRGGRGGLSMPPPRVDRGAGMLRATRPGGGRRNDLSSCSGTQTCWPFRGRAQASYAAAGQPQGSSGGHSGGGSRPSPKPHTLPSLPSPCIWVLLVFALPPSSERLSIAISRNRLGEHLFLRPES
jgi:hypothetical protein